MGLQSSLEKEAGKVASPEAIININMAVISSLVHDTCIPVLTAMVQDMPSSLTAIAHDVQMTVEKFIDSASRPTYLPSHTKNDSDDIHALSTFSSMNIDTYQSSPIVKVSLFEDQNTTDVNTITQRQMVQQHRDHRAGMGYNNNKMPLKISSKKHIYFTSPEDPSRHKRFDEDMEVGDKVHWTYEDYDRCNSCLLYTSPSPRDGLLSRMPSSA